MQDTIKTNIDTLHANVGQLNNIEQPLFIIPYSPDRDTTILGFNGYVVKTLNESLPPLAERKSLFKEKVFVNKELSVINRPNNYSDSWIYGIILFVTILYLILIKVFSNKIVQVIKGAFNQEVLLFPVIFLFVPVMALLCYAPISQYNYFMYFPIASHFGVYMLIFLGVFAFCFTKYILIFFFGALFRTKTICSQYNANQLGFYLLDGIILIPIIFLYYYLPNDTHNTALIISLIVLCILLLIRLIKGLIIVLNGTKFSKFYLFFYLCTVELLPLIIIYKSLISY